MSVEARVLLSEPRRQSPLAALFLTIKALRNLGISQLFIAGFLVLNSPIPGGVFALIPLVILVALGIGLLAWWRYTFLVVDDELRVTRGILSTDTLTVPLDRVQSTSIDQEFLHRLVGLVRLSVDTAGSSEAEFSIDAVERPVAEAIQRLAAEHVVVGAARAASLDVADEPPPPVVDIEIARRSLVDLVKVGLTQPPWAGFAVIGPILVVADDLGSTVGLDLPEVDGVDVGPWLIWVGLALFVGGTIIGALLQVIRAIIADYDLTLTQTATGYRRTAGLLSRTSRASRFPRIIEYRTVRNPAQRALGIATLTLPTIGSGDLMVVGCSSEELRRVRDTVVDADARVDRLDRRISPLEVFLAVRNTAIVLILITIVAVATVGWWGVLVWLQLPIAWYLARRHNERTRWGITGAGIALHDETFTERYREMALRRVQTAVVRRSFFERRRGLATLRLAAAEGAVEIRLIPLEEAEAVRDLALGVVETDRRAWM